MGRLGSLGGAPGLRDFVVCAKCARIGRDFRALLASSSLAALMVGGGAPHAFAACTPVPTSGVNNAGSVSGYCINNETVTGNITNSGKITASGISFTSGALVGHIHNTGTIAGGIKLDAASQINSGATTAIGIIGHSFTGGISNAGTITGGVDIELGLGGIGGGLTTFSGGIVNSGTMTASAFAIQTDGVSTFLGGITNSGGLIAANTVAIGLFNTDTFSGGIVNTSGTISGGVDAISINVLTFTAGLTNGGTITSAGPNGQAAIRSAAPSSISAPIRRRRHRQYRQDHGRQCRRVCDAADVFRRHHQ